MENTYKESQSWPFNTPKEKESHDPMVNRNYKDRLFKFIFGNPENKEWTLSLYNAVNGSHYENADEIVFTTIEDAVYMSMRNDVSFLVDNIMNLYEQQASFNPNMPMRYLIYAGMLYSKFVETNKSYHRFSSVLQKAPTPKCICFYNGTADMEETTILKLSDSFAIGTESDIEVKVTMLNINYGHNRKLLDACRPLKDYSWFVERIRFHQKNMNALDAAIDAALSEMDDDAVIKPFLIANQAEVKNMCITEYDEAKTLAEEREDGFEEGFTIGEANGILKQQIETARTMLSDNIPDNQIIKYSGISPDELKKLKAETI